MRVLIAADKFKGTFDAEQVCAAVGRGVREGGNQADELPVADGGEGTAQALLWARGGEWVDVDSEDALGAPIVAHYAMLGDGATAVVEVAAASGLWRFEPSGLKPLEATTRGTGILIADAIRRGAETVMVAAGGSATTDGGMGIVEALSGIERLPHLVVVSDVRIPFEQAARVFGPQKGASEGDVQTLTARLDRIAAAAPKDPRGIPMSGCAGGVGGGLFAYFGAELVAGAPFVLDEIGFDAALARADLVVTGEGRIDAQTLQGKAVSEVARRAAERDVPCVAVVGSNALEEPDRERLGLDAVIEAGDEAELENAAASLDSWLS